MEHAESIAFVQEKFSAFYSNRDLAVPDVHKREFGFGTHKKIDFRHKAFRTSAELNAYIRQNAPLFASYSTALYEFPDARPMERKVFMGSDLVFDIDAPTHSFAHEHNEIFCVECFGRVKKDSVRIMDYLRDDFGFKGVSLNYSGNKGFHFHLRSDEIRSLSQDSRRQLTEYLTGPESLFIAGEEKGKDTELRGPSEKSFGWGKKFFDHAFAFVEGASLGELKEKGLRGRGAEEFFLKKKTVLELMRKGKWAFAPKKFWDALYAEFKGENGVGVDAHVTLDLARLIRIPGSLHGETALCARVVDAERLPEFSLRECVVFSSEKTINILPQIDIALDFPERLFLKKNEPCEVSLASGLFLLCKGKATLLLREKTW
ncbi:MAG: DNA primase small subunit domain-containing protein [Candidatus Norongarragalinales archaeon]